MKKMSDYKPLKTKTIRGFAPYSSKNRQEVIQKKYEKLWKRKVLVLMTFGIESTQNGKYGINNIADIFEVKK